MGFSILQVPCLQQLVTLTSVAMLYCGISEFRGDMSNPQIGSKVHLLMSTSSTTSCPHGGAPGSVQSVRKQTQRTKEAASASSDPLIKLAAVALRWE